MIVELSVENIAIIERTCLDLRAGFTVLTGETGAGKSLLIDAIQLVLGGRADTELVRTGSTKASVNLVLDLAQRPEVIQRCLELGFEPEDGKLYLQREVLAEGRSQARIGGKSAPISVLRQIGALVVDLHGQHDHQSLLDVDRHIEFLDDWIGSEAHSQRAAVAELHAIWEAKKRDLAALRTGLRDREQRIDLLQYQINEIEAVSPKPGETEELDARLARLKFAERLSEAVFGARNELADSETNARDLLGSALTKLEGVTRFDPTLEPLLEPLRSALIFVDESSHGLAAYADSLESDPGELEEVAARLDALKRLKRKYGEDESAVLEHLEKARRELDLLADSEASEESLAAAVATASSELLSAASKLSKTRQERAVVFADLVAATLRELAMDKAQFSVHFVPKEPAADGCDAVEFYFSANLGEDPKALSKIASGGEMSRVMLAIKTAMAGRAGVPTLIFDEIDSGLSGRAAASVAKLLRALSENYQVLVISHLPQIASRASEHFRIEKNEQGGRVITSVVRLGGEERVNEIARMLAHENVTERALENAREMLA